jgi:CheY-like chemotaxis protein
MNRRVLAAVTDLFFASKIRGTAQALNVSVEFSRSADALFDAAKLEVPSLIILDLEAESVDPLGLVARLKEDEQLREVPVVGFLSHVRTDLQQSARAAGVNQVMPRSAFTSRLPDILLGKF